MYLKIINLDEFIGHSIEVYPNEACALLFSKLPYSVNEVWAIKSVRNISLDPQNSWIPDKSELRKVKKWAIDNQFVEIGNIHTHPINLQELVNEDLNSEDIIQGMLEPSDIDLKYARKFNNIIRGIIVLDQNALYGISFHDKFGNKITALAESVSLNEADDKLTTLKREAYMKS